MTDERDNLRDAVHDTVRESMNAAREGVYAARDSVRAARQQVRQARWEARRQYRGYRCGWGGGLFGPVVLIALGLVFLAIQFNYLNPDRAWGFFWPFILVFFGVRCLADRGRAWLGVCAIVCGVALAGIPFGLWDFDIGRLWPLILIAVGLSMLAGRAGGGGWGWSPMARVNDDGSEATTPSDREPGRVRGAAILGGFQSRVTAQNFTGGTLSACFGGFQVDLRRAGMAGESATMVVDAIFGGGEIRVPENWTVDVQGEGIFGAFTDETRQDTPQPNAPRLIVRGSAVFGGVVVKN